DAIKPNHTPSALESLLTSGSETDLIQQLGLADIVPAGERAIVLRALQALRAKVEAGQIAESIGEYFYAPVWRSLPRLKPVPSSTRSHWVVLVDEGGVGEQLASAMETVGGRCVRRDDFGDLTATAVSAWWTDLLATGDTPAGVL